MYCAISAKNWTRLGSSVLAASMLIVGCAQPRGTLFAPMNPTRHWPALPDHPRVFLVGEISGSDDLNAERSSGEVFRSALRGPRPPIRFNGPQSVALRSPNLLAVADGGGAALHLIDLETREHRIITGWKDERLGLPFGVAWLGDRLFLTDAMRHEVIEFNAAGQFQNRFGSDELVRPVGIAAMETRNQLVVVDGGKHELAVYEVDGKRVKTIGQPGTNPGEFNYPSHICIRGSRLLVADSGSFRVQVFDLDGRFVSSFGDKGDGAGDFSLPKGVAMDSDGHIYVVDAQFENIQMFNDDGQLLMAFGEEGRKPGQFWLPAGLYIDLEDRIWVADSGNRRIQVFEYKKAAS